MGKKKQAQRTKNNVVPASSGRSAELLQSTSGVTLVGFNTLKEGGFIPLLAGVSDELDTNINEDFRLVWKKMNKKDTTTKLKALEEFRRLCQECEVETLKPVLPFWPRLFCALSTDEEHRVREAAHTAHRALVCRAGRNIAPHLKQLVGPWFTGQHDTYAPAASAAQAAFQETFPPYKLIEAIVFCQEEILNYICNNLLDQTPQTLANSQNSSQESKAARYQRVVVSCLNGYALYLKRLPVEHLHKAEEVNLKLVTSSKFWKFSKDPAPIVRAAWFTALVALCENAPFFLANESKHVCTAVFSNLDETDPTTVHTIWQAVLLTFTIVEKPWQHVSLEKTVLPKLWKVLREGADGNASLVFPNLLPLLSKVPATAVSDKTAFYAKFFDSLRAGLKVRSVQISGKETGAVVLAFLECLRYLVSVNCDDKTLCQGWLQTQVMPLLEVVISDPKLHLVRHTLFQGLASLINCWSKPSSNETILSMVTDFWGRLTALTNVLLENTVTDPIILKNYCVAIQGLLVALNKPDTQPRRSLRVKFTSPRKLREEEEVKHEEEEEVESVSSLSADDTKTNSLFEHQRSLFLEDHLALCFRLLETCSDRCKVVLVGHLAQIVAECASLDVYRYILKLTQLDWLSLYKLKLAQWLRDDNIPIHQSLTLIFTLLQYVQDEHSVKIVYSDLGGEDVWNEEGESRLEPLNDKWQAAVEWGLREQARYTTVQHWVLNHGGLSRLVAQLTRDHSCYNMLHNCLRNLRHNAWLTTETLTELMTTLLQNLTDSSTSVEVKQCSFDLLHAALQNTANSSVLSRLSTEHLTSLLRALFTLQEFPPCWQHCLRVLALNTGHETYAFSSACEMCVHLLVTSATDKQMELVDCQGLLAVLEDLITAGVETTTMPAEDRDQLLAAQTVVVANSLSACLRESRTRMWQLYALAWCVDSNLPIGVLSEAVADAIHSTSLHQYVSCMVPLLMLVVRLQTQTQVQEADSHTQGFPYACVKAALMSEDLWQWSLEALQLHSLCRAFQQHFSMTKEYFLLKEKITFILEECGLFSQVRLKDVIKHLNLSILEEGSTSLLHSDSLLKLQTQTVLRDLPLLYDLKLVQRELLPYKSRIEFVKQHFFPEEALEEVAASGTIERNQLTVVTCCFRRLADLHCDSVPISVLDRMFETWVAHEKENRSLVSLPKEELEQVAEVAELGSLCVSHFSAHLTQSSWDACLVATAALSLSVSTTLADSTQSLSLPVVRVGCAVCRLFSAVSAHMSQICEEDKAGLTRRAEWTDVFLPSTHAAIAQAWRIVSELVCDRPLTMLLLESLSSAVSRHVSYPHFTNGDTLTCLDTCCRLLQSRHAAVQLTAYKLLLQLVPAMVELDLKESEQDNIALSCQHVDETLLYTQSIVEVIVSGLKFGDMCIVEPFTDSYSYTRCYLLLWSALLELCGQACSELRALYTTWLKEAYLPLFMKTMFCLMPEAALHGDVPNHRITQFFYQSLDFDKAVVWSSERLAQVSCRVFAVSLRRLPAAVRQWWSEAEHRAACLVENVTATYVSPELCLEEMRAITQQEKKFDNMTVHVSPGAKEVYAVYTVEESRMELVIELAHNHPLGLVKVKSGQRMVSTAQTRQWLLQITIFLTHQNGSIWDALQLWKTSLDKRFEGVEECYICFAILHSASHQLPRLSCQTCRKKFHSHCLYKWFTTSNKSTCPICRNLF